MLRTRVWLFLVLAAPVLLAGCQPRSPSTATRDGRDQWDQEYVTGGVTVAEGDVLKVQLLNAGSRPQTCLVEIYTAKGEELVNTRGQDTQMSKSEVVQLNSHAVGTVEYTLKANGVCWVSIKSNSAELAPQVVIAGKDKAVGERVVYKPGDFLKIESNSRFTRMVGTGSGPSSARRYGETKKAEPSTAPAKEPEPVKPPPSSSK